MANFGVYGSGQVGRVLADGLLKHGHAVMRASRTPTKLAEWQASAGERARVGTPVEAARFGDILVLAVKGSAAEDAVELCGVDNLKGKVVIDTTNPIGGAPEKGVVQFFTSHHESLMERLQRCAPSAHFVKAFSCVGSGVMVDPDYGGIRPSMFICGNNEAAKGRVSGLLSQFGWDVEDMGSVEAARAIEPLCMLWCIPGFQRNEWTHAFKLLKK